MAHVERATDAMFDDIYPLLQGFNNPGLTRDKWRRIFEHDWKGDGGAVGNVLLDKANVVGFIGTLFSRRIICGQEVRLCNLTSWIVKDEYRSESLRLVLPLLKLRDHTFTNLTLSRRAGEIMKRLGFQDLDTNVRLLFPVRGFSGVPKADPGLIVSDESEIVKILDPVDLRSFQDHSQYGCGHVVIKGDSEYCYLVFTRKHRGNSFKIPFGHIHYISNRSLFLKHLNRIKLHFLRIHRCCFLMVEERLIGNRSLPFSKSHALKVPKMFKSDVLTSEQVDNLYTEIVVLGL